MDVARETQIGRDWLKSLALAAISISILAVSLYGVQIEPDDLVDRRLRSASFLMLPAFSLFSVFVIYRLFVPAGALVRLNPVGFIDFRAGRSEIPWNEITNVVRRGEFVVLTLRRGFAKSYPLSFTQRALKLFIKAAGPSQILVADWCLSISQTQLLELIAGYKDTDSCEEVSS